MRNEIRNSLIGKAAELRVASELMLRGFEVHLSIVDDGSDLLVDGITRIQVKSSHGLGPYVNKARPKHYAFSFNSRTRSGKRGVKGIRGVKFSILWAIDDDKFFIIPSEVIAGKYTVRINLEPRGRSGRPAHLNYTTYLGAWDLLKMGAV